MKESALAGVQKLEREPNRAVSRRLLKDHILLNWQLQSKLLELSVGSKRQNEYKNYSSQVKVGVLFYDGSGVQKLKPE